MKKKFIECIYCDEPWADIKYYETVNKGNDEYMIISLDRENNLCVDATAGVYEPNYLETKVKINYCPMCGRKLDDEFNIPTGLTTPEEHEKYLKFGGEIKIIDPDNGKNLVIGEKGFYWENTEGEEDGE